MSYKDRFPEKVRFKILIYLIVGPLFALAYYFFGIDGTNTLVGLLAHGGVSLVFLFLAYTLWQIRENKVQAARWKQRIQHIADCTDRPYEEYSFDEFCEITDDSELERTIEFMEQMPMGQRNVKDAYAKVLAKYGGPI
ncbi:MAG: hypothetical protein ACYC67_18655 [Prosthecobacter sp.]